MKEGFCYMCPVCNGKACGNTIPGPGAKGVGDVAIRNYEKWKEVRVNMNVIGDIGEPSTETDIFGYRLALPLLAGPVGAVKMHYGDRYTDEEYNKRLIRGCIDSKIVALTGDGTDPLVMESACRVIKEVSGHGIPTVKPWDINTLEDKIKLVKCSEAKAFAMDIDAAGLPFLKGRIPPAGRKTVEQLREIVDMAGLPFIVKGIMTPDSALQAVAAGASAIVVSNHGGRVLDQCPSTCEVLEEIVRTVNGKCKILVDGGLRDGLDIFKAIAMGADAVLMARPFVNAIYRNEDEGVLNLVEKLKGELKDAMTMCGATDISGIKRSMIRV